MSAAGDGEAAAASPVDVVAIGTSAGGVSALGIVLGALPADFRAAVVVAQHLDPRHESLMPTLLRRRCRLPVADAVDGERLERSHVYLAPRDAHLVLRGWRVALTEEDRVHFSRPSVDVLFRSVAVAFGARAIGVILTGAGRDGADGVTAIKHHGGVIVVESERRVRGDAGGRARDRMRGPDAAVGDDRTRDRPTRGQDRARRAWLTATFATTRPPRPERPMRGFVRCSRT